MAITSKRAPMGKQSQFILINDPRLSLCIMCRNEFTINQVCDECNSAMEKAFNTLSQSIVKRLGC